jgi:hypothetical protein
LGFSSSKFASSDVQISSTIVLIRGIAVVNS